eukprot:CAMPEP_0172506906 /NCGR_PEP_ID=MMETSP1066-20121228/199418_1 /TAXON_ID=671091 /ORGANISM="Coscinodiscus wailesii, Strain CCMP2513" /LENGTH=284 /DNA_ID=CAMNT_0013284181 /DNA_START=18 /DNA_END=872 /DNA_ORIENTATION=+
MMGRYYNHACGGIVFFLVFYAIVITADDYTVADGNKSILVALGCFWCAEQAFEQYAPGVVEVVSGYAGGVNENPTYRNHPEHYEVVLIEYDPNKTSYEILVNYAYRNMDPFDAHGQFCDKGKSYYPAIFYQNEKERMTAEKVLAEILEMYPDWSEDKIKAPILERPTFWTAEEYHQNYYIKNPLNYGYYKNACRRSQRLKEVWGEDEYKCYHEEEYSCFNMTVLNANGTKVKAELNAKNAPEETAGLLSRTQIIVISICGAVVLIGLIFLVKSKTYTHNKECIA